MVSAAAGTARGQEDTGVLRGLVRDAQGGAITSAAVDIVCGDDRYRATTDAVGSFVRTGLPPSRCRVTASSPLFEPETATVQVTPNGGSASLVLQVRRFSSEVVVTPARGIEETTFSVPEPMSVTSRRDIDSRPYQLVAQVLREEPGVLVQQTTSAQASPIIRGFTGQSNVYLLDGVRLNTGAWRGGPSQYLAWVDGAIVDRIEVVRGSGSVQYGSDALGGTVQVLTRPAPFGLGLARVGGTVEALGGTADKSFGGQADLTIRTTAASIVVGGSGRRVEDLRAGGGKDSHNAVTRFLGLPSTILGSRMRATAFDQGGVHGTGTFGVGSNASLRAFYTHDTQVGASRYDRVLGGEGVYRSGFDPQTLDLGLVRYERAISGLLDGVSATFSVNRQADGRFEQARPIARLDTQAATTTALGYQAQAHRNLRRHQIVVGGELYDESTGASRQLIEPNGIVTPARPDIPDGTSYSNLGIFAQDTVNVSDRLTMRGGLRYSSFSFATKPDALFGVTAEDVTMRSATFQAASIVRLLDGLNLTFEVGRGFRAANAADLGSIGLSGGGGFEITPSKANAMGALVGTTGAADARSTGVRVPALRPEVAYHYELGVKARVGRFSGTLNGFDMEFFDAIQRRALVFDTNVVGSTVSGFQIVRQDAAGLAYIAQDVRPVGTRVNVDRTRILGFDGEGEVQLTSTWTASGYFSMSNGRLLATGEYVRRMPPPMGGAKVRWTAGRLWTEGVLTFAAEQTRLNSGDLSDARIGGLRTRTSIANFFNGTATDLGLVTNGVLTETGETLAQVQNRVLGSATSSPLFTTQAGFAVFGIRAGLRVTPQLDLTVIGENLGDVNYRLYGSGVDAPGVNVQVRTRYRF